MSMEQLATLFLVGVAMLFVLLIFVMVCLFIEIKKKEKYIKHLVVDCRIDESLSDLERTKIKEVRLIIGGQASCKQCGRVSGMFYDTPEGPKGITLKSLPGEGGKGKVHVCTDCIKKNQSSMGEAQQYMAQNKIDKARLN